MWAIWCKELNGGKGDWLMCPECEAILAFKTKAAACKRAAKEYGFDSYSEAKRNKWCEVRSITW